MYRHLAGVVTAAIFSLTPSFAQPVISSQSPIASSASFRTPGLPGSGIAQGSIFSIFGTGLGPDTWVQAGTFPLTTSLGGSSVSVTVGGATVPAIILFAYSTQINAIMPSSTPVGAGTVTVSYNDQTSAAAPVQVVASAFAPFTYNQMGYGQAIATDTNYVKNTIIHAFHPGDYVLLWGTGLGAISGSDAEAPPVGNLSVPITVHVGNATAATSYQGRAPCCAGLDQIVFQVPAGVTGCYVPVGVETGGVVGSITTIAVASSGQTCNDSVLGQDLVSQLAAGQKVQFAYARLESLLAQIGYGNYVKEDFGLASFSEIDPEAAGLAEYGVSNGYCITTDTSPWINVSLADFSPAQLDAGAVSLTGQITVPLTQYYPAGIYESQLTNGNATFLWGSNNFTLAGSGGANVGSFSITELTSTGTIKFSNITYNQQLPRSSDLVIQWTGGNSALQNGQVTIGGYSATTSDFSQSAFFQCTAPFSAGQFTIPKWVLSSLPPSGTATNTSGYSYALGWMWVGQYNKPTTFNATGLSRGILTDVFYNSDGVYFQ
ncbi:MAG TPA: hypothetical protein VMI94_10420 [Bryobacteraceae bacterium]|nr:hypothetical protein [Bryobacteraceae bacterium]